MKAKELMIGDWVRPDQCQVPTVYTSVAMITTDGVYVNEAERLFTFDEIEPISITEEMLLRWGFKFDGMDGFILEQRRRMHDPKDKPSYYIKVIPPQPDNDDWWSPDDTGFEVEGDKGDLLLTGQEDTYYHVLQHLLRYAGLEDIVKLNLED